MDNNKTVLTPDEARRIAIDTRNLHGGPSDTVSGPIYVMAGAQAVLAKLPGMPAEEWVYELESRIDDLVDHILDTGSAQGHSRYLFDRVMEHAQARIQPVASEAGAVPAVSMVAIARRNLRAFLGKASFAVEVDRQAAIECLDVLESAIVAPAAQPQEAGAVPIATLHDDGHYTFHGTKPEGYDRAGWRMDVYAAPPSVPAAEPSFQALLALFYAAGNVVPTKSEAHKFIAEDGVESSVSHIINLKCRAEDWKGFLDAYATALSAPAAESAEPAKLPDPHGCNKCQHPDCGRFNGPRQIECRAMADNACARDYAQPIAATADAQGNIAASVSDKAGCISHSAGSDKQADAQGDERAIAEFGGMLDDLVFAQADGKYADRVHARRKLMKAYSAALSRQPFAPVSAEPTQAARDVLAERRRQIDAEGWTPEHDDQHNPNELAEAGASYAMAFENQPMPMDWPWEVNWWKPKGKPKDRRSNLVKAGALILAEIERLDRAALAAAKPEGGSQ